MNERLTKAYGYRDGYHHLPQFDHEAVHDKLGVVDDILFGESGSEVISLNHLREIAAAEREGRVVVLPCKVGSDVWLVLPDYTECSAHGEKYSEYSCAGCESECDSKQTQTIKRHKNVSLLSLGGWIASKCFGKTVFLTRAEAEAALAGKGESHER